MISVELLIHSPMFWLWSPPLNWMGILICGGGAAVEALLLYQKRKTRWFLLALALITLGLELVAQYYLSRADETAMFPGALSCFALLALLAAVVIKLIHILWKKTH